MADITLFPNGDRAISGWQDEGDGTTDIFNSIDEGTTSPNDSDYVHDNDGDDTSQFDLDASPGDTSEVTSVDLSVRAMKESGGKDRLLEAKIWINSLEVANLTWTVVEYDGVWLTKSTGAQSGSWTKAQIDAAYIEFISTSSGGGGPREVRVSAAQLAIVYTEGGATFFQSADATAIGVGVEAETSERFRIHSATAIGIAAIATIATFLRTISATAIGIATESRISTFLRTFPATAIGIPLMTKKMFETFPATAVGIAVVTSAKMFTKTADAVAIGIAAFGAVPTYVRSFVATAVGVAAESRLATFFRTIPATAVGVAEATKKMFETFDATAIGIGGLSTAKFFVITADAVAIGIAGMTLISTFLRTFAATAVGIANAGLVSIYVRIFAATAIGIATITKKLFETFDAVAIGVAGTTTAKLFLQTADAVAVGIGAMTNIITYLRTFSATAIGVASESSSITFLRTFATTATGIPEMTKKMFATFAATAIGIATSTTALVFSKTVDAVAIGVAVVDTVNIFVRVIAATAIGVAVSTLVTTILGATSTIEYRKTTVEYLREFIGDQDKLIYTDQELDAILRGHVFPSRVNERLNAILSRYYSLLPSPVLDLTIIDPVVGNHYRIDESTKHVQFISGTPPTETTSIEVQYVRVNFFSAVADILVDIAIDKAKLAVIARTGNVSIDMTQLSRKLMLQAQRISVLNYWEFGAGYG